MTVSARAGETKMFTIQVVLYRRFLIAFRHLLTQGLIQVQKKRHIKRGKCHKGNVINFSFAVAS